MYKCTVRDSASFVVLLATLNERDQGTFTPGMLRVRIVVDSATFFIDARGGVRAESGDEFTVNPDKIEAAVKEACNLSINCDSLVP